MRKFIAFGAFFLVPAAAFATPYFHHNYSEAGYFLDVNNAEERSYECKASYDFDITENGVTKSHHMDQTLVIPAKFSGRLISMASTPQSIVRTYRYNIFCN